MFVLQLPDPVFSYQALFFNDFVNRVSMNMIPSFFSRHCNFNEHLFVFFRNAITLSFIRMGVSLGLVLGLVDRGSSPASLYARNRANHLSMLL